MTVPGRSNFFCSLYLAGMFGTMAKEGRRVTPQVFKEAVAAAKKAGCLKALLLLTDREGSSCLHFAANLGLVGVFKETILAANDADCLSELLVLLNNNGASCAHLAEEAGHQDILDEGVAAAAEFDW